ncbi:unnamed protein product, partial [Allacma fusca]
DLTRSNKRAILSRTRGEDFTQLECFNLVADVVWVIVSLIVQQIPRSKGRHAMATAFN